MESWVPKAILVPALSMCLLIGEGIGLSMAKDSRSSREAQCAAEWEVLRGQYGHDYRVLLKEWTKLESRCRGTGLYEYRLSTLYERLGDREKAKRTVEEALRHGTENDNILKLGKYSHEFIDLVTARERDLTKYQRLEAGYKALVAEEPKWSAAYEALANLQLYIGKRDEAIANAKAAVGLNGASWGGCRTLVVAYTGARRYAESKPHIRKCIELNDELLGDVDFMFAAAATYANVQEPETAKTVIEALLGREPDARNDPRFGPLVSFISGKLGKTR